MAVRIRPGLGRRFAARETQLPANCSVHLRSLVRPRSVESRASPRLRTRTAPSPSRSASRHLTTRPHSPSISRSHRSTVLDVGSGKVAGHKEPSARLRIGAMVNADLWPFATMPRVPYGAPITAPMREGTDGAIGHARRRVPPPGGRDGPHAHWGGVPVCQSAPVVRLHGGDDRPQAAPHPPPPPAGPFGAAGTRPTALGRRSPLQPRLPPAPHGAARTR